MVLHCISNIFSIFHYCNFQQKNFAGSQSLCINLVYFTFCDSNYCNFCHKGWNSGYKYSICCRCCWVCFLLHNCINSPIPNDENGRIIGNLSSCFPWSNFYAFISFVSTFNERPSVFSIVGALITLLGAYVLNVSKSREGLLKPIKLLFENKASAMMIFSVLGESITIVFDKLAINNTSPKNPIFTLLIENIFVIISLLPILYLKNKNLTQQIFANKKFFIIIGFLNACSTILAFSTIGGGSIGIASAIFKLQLLFVLLFSFIFFKDRPKLETIIGSIIMILGVVLIKIGL